MYKILFLVLISNMALAQNKVFQSQNSAYNAAKQAVSSDGDGLPPLPPLSAPIKLKLIIPLQQMALIG